MSVEHEFNKLKEVVSTTQDDVDKFLNGNKVAGTRVRKAMQEVKIQAQEVRKAILQKKES